MEPNDHIASASPGAPEPTGLCSLDIVITGQRGYPGTMQTPSQVSPEAARVDGGVPERWDRAQS